MQHRQTGKQSMRKSKNANGPLHADPNRAMQEMMDTIDQVRNVYERETEALDRLDTKAFIAIQDEKIQATNIYKTRIEEILRRKAEMKNVEPHIKRDLEQMQANFAELSSKNMNSLKRMQKTMTRLGETVQKVAKESVNKEQAFSYGNSGRLDSHERKSVSIGVSETA